MSFLDFLPLHFDHACLTMGKSLLCQVRRTRAWFPCVDVPLGACPFDMHFTVSAAQFAVSCGKLLKMTWASKGKQRCFHYKLVIPTPPQDIALAIGKSLCYTQHGFGCHIVYSSGTMLRNEDSIANTRMQCDRHTQQHAKVKPVCSSAHDRHA